MTNKEKYRILCEQETSLPVMFQEWWLDCVCGKEKWDVLLIETKGVIEACMPVFMPYPKVVSMPAYTLMGIWFNPGLTDINYARELMRKQKVCEQFLLLLSENKSFFQLFHYSFTDWLPFYWAGYRQTTRYTYIIQDIANLDDVWNNFSGEIKKNISKAQNKYRLTVKRGVSVDDFLSLNEQIFERQGKSPFKPQVLKNLINISRSQNAGDVWGAYDEQNQLHAAQFLVWQEGCAYCIAGGSSRNFGKTGAHALVIWEAIRFASAISADFNFMGSMIKGVEYFNRGFGSKQIPYHAISKGKLSLFRKVMLKAFDMLISRR